MAGIRTAMVTTPALLGDLIERLAARRIKLSIVARLDGRRALAQRLKRLRPQLVVIGLRDDESDAVVRALLMQLPTAKFIALGSDGRGIVGYGRALSPINLADLSPERLVSFVVAADGSGEA